MPRGKRSSSEASALNSDCIHSVVRKRKKRKFGYNLVFDNNKKLNYTPPLICSVCEDYIVAASTATCGHTYCEDCLNEWIIFSKECVVCRKYIRGGPSNPSYVIDNIIEQVLSNPQNRQGYDKWLLRRQKHKNWLESKT